MSEYRHIRYDVSGRVCTVTLDRPDRGNAFTPVMQRELVSAFDAADADDGVRAVIVTGAGRHFCVGADLRADGDEPAPAELVDGVPRDGGGVVSLRIAALRKPVIAAVNGTAVGVGVTMTLPMDIRIAAESARFGLVFARRGIVPEAASSWFLPRVVGIAWAMEWVATGRIFDAAEAKAGGLVTHVVADHTVLDAARTLATEIAGHTSGVSVAAARQMLWSMLSEASPWAAHLTESRVLRQLHAGPDPAEGRASFFEKRPPDFPARVSTDYPQAAPSWP
ncbi:MAG TPA: enoyl-CoA hydratase-related protein [Amycolatopsis sp.]|nr:enoyl-CoA hydratase-related protein [Amycolatopsis sp.]